MQALSSFGQMHSSIVAAQKAYETAKSMMASMSVDELLVAIEALSRLAYNCSVLVAAQAYLLLSYAFSDSNAVVRAFSLKCLVKLTKKAAGRTGIEETAIENFILINEHANDHLFLKELALRVLRELLPFCVLVSDVDHLTQLFSMIESRASCVNWPQGRNCLGFLVDFVCVLGKLRPDIFEILDAQSGLEQRATAASFGWNQEKISGMKVFTRVISVTCNQIVLLGREYNINGLVDGKGEDAPKSGMLPGSNDMRKRCSFLCQLLLQLAQYSAQCGFVVVDNISRVIEAVLEKFMQMEFTETRVVAVSSGSEVQGVCMPNVDGPATGRSIFLRSLCRCVKDCGLFWLSKEGPSSICFVRMTKLIALITSANLPLGILIDSFGLILKAQCYSTSQIAKAVEEKVNLTLFFLIKEEDFWSAYKVLTDAACHGLWRKSSAAIERFMHRAQSENTLFWLKALCSLCEFEASLQTGCSSTVMKCSVSLNESDVGIHACVGKLGQSIAKAIENAHAAETYLVTAAKPGITFEFQRYLLNLRVTFVRIAGELLGLMAPICDQIKETDVEAIVKTEPPTKEFPKGLISNTHAIAIKLITHCVQLKKLGLSFDVLRVSTIGIDKDSMDILSFAALGCSFLCFCILSSVCIPHILASGSKVNASIKSLAASVANDLYVRLGTSYRWKCTGFLNFILHYGSAKAFPIMSKDAFGVYYLQEAHRFVTSVIQEIFLLQGSTNLEVSDVSLAVLMKGMHLSRTSLERWLHLPWLLPKHFLCTRPLVSMDVFLELMVDASVGKKRDVPQGHVAPLTMCFQLSNVEVDSKFTMRRLACAVLLKPWKMGNEELYENWSSIEMFATIIQNDDDLFLLDQLVKKVSFTKGTMPSDLHGRTGDGKAFKPVPPIILCDISQKGQGFASCVYDTSWLQCGLYSISIIAVGKDKNHLCWIIPSKGKPFVIQIVPPKCSSTKFAHPDIGERSSTG
ncbi:hypothetical protein KP509_1Z244300 [Ceratopteris richardii]|nr:hypothetical protein KP509_1Z244300 [Ceratopteris richardii]